jgi:hypothetical protein
MFIHLYQWNSKLNIKQTDSNKFTDFYFDIQTKEKKIFVVFPQDFFLPTIFKFKSSQFPEFISISYSIFCLLLVSMSSSFDLNLTNFEHIQFKQWLPEKLKTFTLLICLTISSMLLFDGFLIIGIQTTNICFQTQRRATSHTRLLY